MRMNQQQALSILLQNSYKTKANVSLGSKAEMADRKRQIRFN